MAAQQPYPSLEALRKLEASLNADLRAQDAWTQGQDEVHQQRASPLSRTSRFLFSRSSSFDRRMRLLLWWPRLRKLTFVGGTIGGLVLLATGALWWRLSSGPIELDIATPWLTAAIAENFGGGHEVEIGGTQLERDAMDARRCAFATSWCATPKAPSWRARRRRRSAFPVLVCSPVASARNV